MSSRTAKILKLAIATDLNGNQKDPIDNDDTGSASSLTVGLAESGPLVPPVLDTVLIKSGDKGDPKIDVGSTIKSVSPEPLISADLVTETQLTKPDKYIVESRNSTSINLRRIPRLTYNDPADAREHNDFSSGSSDDFSPGSEDLSSDSSEHMPGTSNQNAVFRQRTFNSSETTENNGKPASPKKGKKRSRNPDNWIREKAKRLRNCGQSYTSKSGKIIGEKKMGPPCKEKCILSCSKKINENFRNEMFKEYWAFSSLQRQRDFLAAHIEKLDLKYRRISAAKPRNPNCSFYISKEGHRIRVCKTFLINTLGINERTIRTVIKSKARGTGIVPTDNRGKHQNHKKIDEEILKSVRDHINSVPRIESHYVRKDTKREFIDGGLSVAELYRNYSTQRSSINKIAASYDKYSRIFNKEFNIGFFLPKKDQCDVCEAYKNSQEEEKENLEINYQSHLEEKELSRSEKQNDKEKARNNECVLAVYDLQAVLPIPTGQSSAFFYKSRINCYNFTVSRMGIFYPFLKIPLNKNARFLIIFIVLDNRNRK